MIDVLLSIVIAVGKITFFSNYFTAFFIEPHNSFPVLDLANQFL